MQVLKSSAAPARIIDGADFSIAIYITPRPTFEQRGTGADRCSDSFRPGRKTGI